MFSIDMNAVRGDTVGALLTHTTDPVRAQLSPPVPGDLVEVVEHEGDWFLATVVAVDGIWVGLRIHWDTCVPALDEPVVRPADQTASTGTLSSPAGHPTPSFGRPHPHYRWSVRDDPSTRVG